MPLSSPPPRPRLPPPAFLPFAPIIHGGRPRLCSSVSASPTSLPRVRRASDPGVSGSSRSEISGELRWFRPRNRPVSISPPWGNLRKPPDPLLPPPPHRKPWNRPALSEVRPLASSISRWIAGVALVKQGSPAAEARNRRRRCVVNLGLYGQRCYLDPALLRMTRFDPWCHLAPATWKWCNLVPALIGLSPPDPKGCWGPCFWIPLLVGPFSCRIHSQKQTPEWLWYKEGFDIAHEDKGCEKEGTPTLKIQPHYEQPEQNDGKRRRGAGRAKTMEDTADSVLGED